MKFISLLLVIVGLGSCHNQQIKKTVMEGSLLPEFNLLLSDSITYFNTKSIPNDKPVILFYFGPNCPYSRAQMEEIIQNIRSLKNIRFYVFTVWPYAQMKSFYEYYQLEKYPNIITGIDYTNFFSDYFKVYGVPFMALYGTNKRLINIHNGYIYSKYIKESIKE